jgi:predicted RNase H-like HicB family nuclease
MPAEQKSPIWLARASGGGSGKAGIPMMPALKKGTRVHGRVAEVDEVAIRLRIKSLKEGGYVATSPDVPGLVAEGRSITETVEIAQGLTRKLVESCLENGDPVPPSLRKIGGMSFELRVPVGIR